MKRLTKQLREKARPKKTKEPKEERMCANCIHAVPYTRDHLRNKDRAPIMCSCQHQEHLMLLRHDVCEKWQPDLLATFPDSDSESGQ